MKILLVEDSPTLRHATSTYIRNAGHDPILAKSGEEALQIVDTTPVDMIIMDVEMPGLDGFETTRLIREWLGEHWVPIIFVTGLAEDANLREGIDVGGDDYLVKPVNQVILSAKIRAMERILNMRNELNRLNEELVQLSQRDSLTGLFNRRTFEEKSTEVWRHATRSQQPVTVILMDIDYFKLYNDEYGHQAGDRCIRMVANALHRCLNRPNDIVARYGGEEFIALLPNTPIEGAQHVTELIRETVEEMHIKHRGSKMSDRVTVSLGSTTTNFTTAIDLNRLISQADRALYEAKNDGRNRATVTLHSPEATVLVVDDDEQSLNSIHQALEGHCALISTGNATECLRFARDRYPDIILLEVYLPGVNGFEICRKLKADPDTSHIPVVLLSSSSETSELIEFARQVKASACFQKPLDTHKLIAHVRKALKS
ncbi:diguanylate cyclase domain-containing protein [Teredinibacter turnerae]|uniref:diguanylate cyclase domain-containing protein n=1 Tax=Teredinibacter turnerae TaxID=2426 RepID=UPI00036AB9CA|nr:diguanylate cyclase [Teredinibacter turnerae]